MKVTDKRAYEIFGNIPVGTCFGMNDTVYIKAVEISCDKNGGSKTMGVNLEDGSIMGFKYDTPVETVTTEVIVK